MHDSMKAKLSKLKERLAEIQKLLIDSETIKDMDNYTLLNKEFADLKPIVCLLYTSPSPRDRG